ncbi:hypothetical protein ACF3NA_08080 [Alkanindiges sp. WGS2144]|uniref:hypothetical protein n=1 Tax=Alkanindiges sp. WGS2144 TaxID=3366808 RepID=UPI0037510230
MRGFKTIKLLSVALVSLLMANQGFAWAIGTQVIHSNPQVKDYDDLDFDLNGLSGTLQLGEFDSLLSPAVHAQYATGKANSLNGKVDVNYFEGTATAGQLIYSTSNFVLRGTAGIGIGIADLKVKTEQGTNNTDASFVVIPVGLEANYLVPNTNLSFFGTAGYKWYLDVSDDRIRCADGSVSSDSGYHVCDNKGGFAADTKYPVGKMDGIQFGIGAKLYY